MQYSFLDEILELEKELSIIVVENEPISTTTIKNCIPQRWSSINEMLLSFQGKEISINNFLSLIHLHHLTLTDHEILLIRDLVKFLSIFAESTRMLTAEKNSTIDAVIPLLAIMKDT